MKLYHKILLCLFLLLGVTIWEFVTVEPVQADPGGVIPPATHVILLDVSGSMSSNNPKYGQYGTYANGFADSVVQLFAGLLAPDGKTLRAEDNVVIMPFTSDGAAGGRVRKVVKGLTLADFVKALNDPNQVPGPGDGGWGKGMVPHLKRAMDLPGAADGVKGIRFYWILTDNGLGNAPGQDPFPYYRQLRDDERFSHVWFMPLNCLPKGNGNLVLYLILQHTDEDSVWTNDLFKLLQERLNGKIWPNFKREIVSFRPLIKKVKIDGKESRALILKTSDFETSENAGSENDEWDRAVTGLDGSYEVPMTCDEQGNYQGELRFKAALPDGWKLKRLTGAKYKVTDKSPDDVDIRIDPSGASADQSNQFPITLSFLINKDDAEQLIKDGASANLTLSCRGLTKVSFRDSSVDGSALAINPELLRGVENLDVVLNYLVLDSRTLNEEQSLPWMFNDIKVTLSLEKKSKTGLVVVFGIATIVLLIGIGLLIMAFTRGSKYRFCYKIFAKSGSELQNGELDFTLGGRVRKAELDIDGSKFVSISKSDEDFLVLFADQEPSANEYMEDSLEDLSGALEQNHELFSLAETYSHSMPDGRSVTWHIEKGSGAGESDPYVPQEQSQEEYI